jgi:replication factor C subunit 3/5
MSDVPSLAANTAPSASSRRDSTLPWVEKFRPSTLDGVVAHEDILDTLKHLMATNNLPHLLFYGPPGTGKTTTVKACATHLFGKDRVKGNVLELNASDDRGIDVVRNQIKEFSSTTSIFSMRPAVGAQDARTATVKLVVLDEADQMSNDAQAALRRVIEKYTKNVRFVIICNHINKLIPALQSRCTRFRFGPVKKAQMMPRLREIMTSEGIEFNDEGLSAALKLSNGDMRRCLNMLQATTLSLGAVTEENIYVSTGNPTPQDVRTMTEIMFQADFSSAWASVKELVEVKGYSVVDIVRELYPTIIRLDLPMDCKAFVLAKLADMEYNLSAGTSESTALAGVLGAMQLVKEAVSLKRPIMMLSAC